MEVSTLFCLEGGQEVFISCTPHAQQCQSSTYYTVVLLEMERNHEGSVYVAPIFPR